MDDFLYAAIKDFGTHPDDYCYVAEVKERGYQRASLGVNKENYAVRMYQHVGFAIVGDGADETEYLMICELN